MIRSGADAGIGNGTRTGGRRRRGIALASAIAVALITPAAAVAKCEVQQILELKSTMVGDKPMVDTSINGQPARFVVDSGAFFSVISPGSAAALGLKLSAAPPGFTLRGIGGSASVSVTKVKDFTLAGVPIHNIDFIVGGSAVGTGAGLLGQNVLGLADVEYDMAHGAVRLMRSTDCKTTNLAYWATGKPVSILPIDERSPRQPHTIATITINGKKIRAVFDTGAGGSLLSLAAARRAGITPDSPGVLPGGFSRGLGSKIVRSWIAPVESVKLGDGEEVRHSKIRIGDIDLGNADMLIGIDFFLSHRVYVANKDRRLYFTYEGGPLFNIDPKRVIDGEGTAIAVSTDDGDPAPTDAAGFSRRGAAYAARHRLDDAVADFSRAIDLAPTEGRYRHQRAMARLALRQPALAMTDLDQALTLDPGDADSHIVRARLRLARRDTAGAIADLDAAARSEAPSADARLAIAQLYSSADALDPAVAQFDLWIAAHRADSGRPSALNGRCWALAQLDRDLDRALADCNEAVRARPGNAAYLDSRALVHLRRGALDKALADYNATLAIDPRARWSLYGRGIVERRRGDTKRGDADIAAAVALDPGLPARAAALGLAR